MNCKECQTKMMESLAASETVAPEVARHQQACAACTAFYSEQERVFRAMDAGLHSLMNQSVPASLLASVRTRLDEMSARPNAWWPRRSITAVASAAILVVAVAYAWHRPHSFAKPGQIPSIAPERSMEAEVIHDTAHTQPLAIPSGLRSSKHKHRALVTPSDAAPEVIVSAEEPEAFANFIADIPKGGPTALALVQPAQPKSEDPTEIALLDIEPLKVKPMELSSGQ
jgi:hypothetical protein